MLGQVDPGLFTHLLYNDTIFLSCILMPAQDPGQNKYAKMDPPTEQASVHAWCLLNFTFLPVLVFILTAKLSEGEPLPSKGATLCLLYCWRSSGATGPQIPSRQTLYSTVSKQKRGCHWGRNFRTGQSAKQAGQPLTRGEKGSGLLRFQHSVGMNFAESLKYAEPPVHLWKRVALWVNEFTL